jgi:hypothetical protein
MSPIIIDSEFAQLEDAENKSHVRWDDCEGDTCNAFHILQRRVDRHRHEINELKDLMITNVAGIDEVLSIIRSAKTFFSGLGWFADKIKSIASFVVVIGGAVAVIWYKQK